MFLDLNSSSNVQTKKQTLLRIHAGRQRRLLLVVRLVPCSKHHGTPLLLGDVFEWAPFRNVQQSDVANLTLATIVKSM